MATQFIENFASTADIPSSLPNAQGIGAVGGQLFLAGGQPVGGSVKKSQFWFVDAINGSTVALNRGGTGWADALSTVAAVFGSAQAAGGTAIKGRYFRSGDVLVISGKVQEQLTTPIQVFDVTVIGLGNRPRHADASPAGGNYAASTWAAPASPAAGVPLLTVLQQGWRFKDMLFAGPTDAASVRLQRTAEGADETDASHAEFINCRFPSGLAGVESHGGVSYVGIYGCFFQALTGHVVKITTGAGIGIPSFWVLEGNRVTGCANFIQAVGALDWRIQENSIMTTTTLVTDFTGGARNVVVRNVFNITAANFDPAGGVTGSGATDVWSNTLIDAIETGLPAN